jgi:hypothetical protein
MMKSMYYMVELGVASPTRRANQSTSAQAAGIHTTAISLRKSNTTALVQSNGHLR